MRGVGLGLLALMPLTLAKVSPFIQAVLGKIVGCFQATIRCFNNFQNTA
jgi:hypothetical protein